MTVLFKTIEGPSFVMSNKIEEEEAVRGLPRTMVWWVLIVSCIVVIHSLLCFYFMSPENSSILMLSAIIVESLI